MTAPKIISWKWQFWEFWAELWTVMQIHLLFTILILLCVAFLLMVLREIIWQIYRMYEDYLYIRKQEQIQSAKKVDVIDDKNQSQASEKCTDDDNTTKTQQPIEPNKTDITVPHGTEYKAPTTPADNMPIPCKNPVATRHTKKSRTSPQVIKIT